MVQYATGGMGMKRFGADVYDNEIEEVPIPVEDRCAQCGEGFSRRDSGFFVPHVGAVVGSLPYHRECFLRNVVGSLGHQRRECECFGGEGCGDPPGMSLREAAQAAVDYYLRHADREMN